MSQVVQAAVNVVILTTLWGQTKLLTSDFQRLTSRFVAAAMAALGCDLSCAIRLSRVDLMSANDKFN